MAQVQVAASIPEAERILADGFKPSVVVVDLQLDGERGETLIAKMRARPASRAVPIVALSGDHISLRRLATVDRGILKPPDPDDLIATIRACAKLRSNLRRRSDSRTRHGISGP